jgi:hypothetical protein
LDEAGQHKSLMVNNISLAQMQRNHLGSFVQVNRNLIVRDKHMQFILPTSDGKDHVMYVHHVNANRPSRLVIQSLSGPFTNVKNVLVVSHFWKRTSCLMRMS